MLQKYDRILTGFIWLMTGSMAVSCEHGNMFPGTLMLSFIIEVGKYNAPENAEMQLFTCF
jgi:hypothetical protein